ncbi:YchJ family metal-binding protein [Streptomyces caniscabiei]|uniref:YchJ family protein n=1 Tax=Streptomyces caniscabiei TaxID=2746961 RepID=UPI0029A37910|nr:YchJ family metal-binding protein [Streptomyces caniscabiei]MDX2603294.1 YchJ family metal-binding protein [Streptomyces caniscabiei]MDX2740370.1 YchJ family metal-binding protein [Streptomyces caniscabiei]MDX2779247.1 YchJ family metal-binding protein [Streptomyces caniscabiei]
MSSRRSGSRARSKSASGVSSPAPRACPCGQGKTYEECCGRYHSGSAAAPTAEALMRSRYSAFVVRDEAYLLRSWHPRTRPADVAFDTTMRWTGLEILDTADGTPFHTTGTVTFRASFRGGSMHERSRFERVDGAWVYVDGEFLADDRG